MADTSQQLEERLQVRLNDLGAKIDGISVAELTDSDRGILRGVASGVARLRWPVPRLACLLPDYPEVLTEDERGYSQWSARLQGWCDEREEADRRTCCEQFRRFCASKEKVRRKLRLFFLCAHDLSLAECGPGGQGYEIKELLEWVKRAMPRAKLGVILAGIVLRTCTGLSLPLDHLESAFRDTLGEAVSDMFSEAGSIAVGRVTDATVDALEDDEGMSQLKHSLKAQKVT